MTIRIAVLSDLHGYEPKTTGGDLLIIAGDLTASDKQTQYDRFFFWLDHQKYSKKIIVGGNHDGWLAERDTCIDYFPECDYLCDEGTEFEGIKIWGSPHTKTFIGINPLCAAFMCDTEEDLNEYWQMIPLDTDILITHGPPKGILDTSYNNNRCGSETLLRHVMEVKPRYHFFGHIHECGGKDPHVIENTHFINASHVDHRYKPVNPPINITYE